MSPLEGTLELKWFLSEEAATLPPRAFVPLFHEWIREDRLPGETLIDVADYSHVREGPGVVLLGHRVSYGIDSVTGRTGLVCRFGRGDGEGGASRLERAFFRALRACRALEEESAPTPIRFRTDEVRLRILDRLRAPRADSTWESVVAEVEPLFRRLFGEATSFHPRALSGDREPFAVTVRTAPPRPIALLLSTAPEDRARRS